MPYFLWQRSNQLTRARGLKSQWKKVQVGEKVFSSAMVPILLLVTLACFESSAFVASPRQHLVKVQVIKEGEPQDARKPEDRKDMLEFREERRKELEKAMLQKDAHAEKVRKDDHKIIDASNIIKKPKEKEGPELFEKATKGDVSQKEKEDKSSKNGHAKDEKKETGKEKKEEAKEEKATLKKDDKKEANKVGEVKDTGKKGETEVSKQEVNKGDKKETSKVNKEDLKEKKADTKKDGQMKSSVKNDKSGKPLLMEGKKIKNQEMEQKRDPANGEHAQKVMLEKDAKKEDKKSDQDKNKLGGKVFSDSSHHVEKMQALPPVEKEKSKPVETVTKRNDRLFHREHSGRDQHRHAESYSNPIGRFFSSVGHGLKWFGQKMWSIITYPFRSH